MALVFGEVVAPVLWSGRACTYGMTVYGVCPKAMSSSRPCRAVALGWDISL